MKTKTPCIEITDPSQVGFPIRLYQYSSGRFSVVYGSETHDGLTYSEAAKELGLCIFHALACIGRITNSHD